MIWRFVGVTHTKAVIGWSMPEHMRTYLIYDTITMAASNVELQPGAVFHSDSEYVVAGSFGWSDPHSDRREKMRKDQLPPVA